MKGAKDGVVTDGGHCGQEQDATCRGGAAPKCAVCPHAGHCRSCRARANAATAWLSRIGTARRASTHLVRSSYSTPAQPRTAHIPLY